MKMFVLNILLKTDLIFYIGIIDVLGEIDIIAKKDDIIRFIEVKFRGSDSYGSALEAVDFRKQRRIMRAASWF